MISDIKLFAAATHAYGVLADVRNQWPGRHTLEGQRLLCDLRDALSEASGVDAEYVQRLSGASHIVGDAHAKAGAA